MKKMDESITYEILPDDFNQNDLVFKVIIIGDSGVGKSCLTIKAIKNTFQDEHNSTIGFEFYTFNVKINDKSIKLQIWDTCGQEVYRSLINSFYRNACLAILVYSIDNEKTFENANNWLKELKIQSSPDVKVFLVANKNDLEDKRQCSKEKGEQFASEHGFGYFTEASAKSGFNIQKIFIQAASTLYKEYNKYNKDLFKTESSSPVLQNSNETLQSNNSKSGRSCCIII